MERGYETERWSRPRLPPNANFETDQRNAARKGGGLVGQAL